MFVSVMIGGGMLYIEDKARGVHEGFLVTPITKLELVMGLRLVRRPEGDSGGGGSDLARFTGVRGLGVIFRPGRFAPARCS